MSAFKKGRFCFNIHLLLCQTHLSEGSALPVFVTIRRMCVFLWKSPEFLCFPKRCHFLLCLSLSQEISSYILLISLIIILITGRQQTIT